jgi:predicted ABC-class ATPase
MLRNKLAFYSIASTMHSRNKKSISRSTTLQHHLMITNSLYLRNKQFKVHNRTTMTITLMGMAILEGIQWTQIQHQPQLQVESNEQN